MLPSLTCYGGVGEIGGNKLLIEDKDSKVLFDFGSGFSDGEDYFGSMLMPRLVNGAGDLFEFDLLPNIPGLYSVEALQNTELKHVPPEVDAIVVSHYHMDHTGRIRYVDPDIPVYCGETTALIDAAYARASSSTLKGHKIRKFRTGDKLHIGSLEVIPVHVDHSIPGAYGFIIHTSDGVLVYTGDFRFHGPLGKMTEDFIAAAAGAKPDLLVSEGTRVARDDSKANMSEESVLKEAKRAVTGNAKLAISSFRGNDTDRINTFNETAKATGRRLVVSMRTALLLEKLQEDTGLRVPRVGPDVDVYVKRKRSGRIDERDYALWERQFLDRGVTAETVKKGQGGYFLHLEAWSFTELIDIKPERGGTYIHAATEAFNEEGEQEEEIIKNWVDHLGFSYHQLHASGHAPMGEVEGLVRRIGAKRVVPVHTEHPDLFETFRIGERWNLNLPTKGTPIAIAGG